MGLFRVQKPRGFHHSCIYVDERREKLAKMEEDARRQLGILPAKEIKSEDIRGKFIEGTTHLKRRINSKRRPFSVGVAFFFIALLVFLWYYLLTV
jgi:hypothetical protein